MKDIDGPLPSINANALTDIYFKWKYFYSFANVFSIMHSCSMCISVQAMTNSKVLQMVCEWLANKPEMVNNDMKKNIKKAPDDVCHFPMAFIVSF